MLPRRIIVALLLAASVPATGCIKDAARSLGELHGLKSELTNRFGDEVNVHLGQGMGPTLTITFINSALNDKTPAERGQRAQETVFLVKAHYVRIRSVRQIWVSFVRQETRFGFFHYYTEGFEVYGFDAKGERLSISRDDDSVFVPRVPVQTGYRYLAPSNESEVSVEGLQLDGEPSGNKGVVVLPHFKVSGDLHFIKAPPPAQVSFDFASYSDKEEFAQVTPIAFVADGTTIVQTEGTFLGGNTQFCYLNVAYADFRQMIQARQLTIKLGAREFPLTPEQFAGLQKMVEVLKD